MFERFTEQAREVVVQAQEEARRLNHRYIGTEHILLGLLRKEEGVAVEVLRSLGMTHEAVRQQVMRIVGAGEKVTVGQMPFTPGASKVLALAHREALGLDHNYVGTEHILLGLARVNEGAAARILLDFDADSVRIRNDIMRELSGGRQGLPPEQPPAESALRPHGPEGSRRERISQRPRPHPPPPRTWLQGLDQLEADIREAFGRGLDLGDLLIVLASVPDTLAARTLGELRVDVDALWGTVERLRRQEACAAEERTAKLEKVRRAKEEALAAQEFGRAASLRDQERALLEQQASEQATPSPEALDDIRTRLGIPRAPDE